MKKLLTRLWHWLINLFGADRHTGQRRRETDGLPPAARPVGLPPVEQPPPPAPPAAPTVPPVAQMDIATDEPPRYRKVKALLSFQERKLYLALLRAVEDRYQLLAKVRLGDLVYLENNPADAKYHRNRVLCKHVDFLLCVPGSLAPLLAVELDDSSHRFPDSQARDEFKNELFTAVGLPLLRIELQSGYRSALLRDQIETLLGTRG